MKMDRRVADGLARPKAHADRGSKAFSVALLSGPARSHTEKHMSVDDESSNADFLAWLNDPAWDESCKHQFHINQIDEHIVSLLQRLGSDWTELDTAEEDRLDSIAGTILCWAGWWNSRSGGERGRTKAAWTLKLRFAVYGLTANAGASCLMKCAGLFRHGQGRRWWFNFVPS